MGARGLLLSLFLIAVLVTLHAQRATKPTRSEARRRPDCPLCDSSVFSYCSDKLLHDACCCLDPYQNALPLHCRLADCSFLHSNTCAEHELITSCCCDRL